MQKLILCENDRIIIDRGMLRNSTDGDKAEVRKKQGQEKFQGDNTMNENEYNNNDFMRNDDTSGNMFLNDKYNDDMPLPEPRNIYEAISDVSDIMKDYSQMANEEKKRNGGKMISDTTYAQKISDPNTILLPARQGKAVLALIAAIIIGAMASLIMGKAGFAFGIFYIGTGLLLSLKDQSGKRVKLPLALVFLLFGLAMIITDIITGNNLASAILFLISMVPILITNNIIISKRDKSIRERATYQIEAVCIKIDEDVRQSSDSSYDEEVRQSSDSSYKVYRPVFEINYMGMTKRLMGYQKYRNLPYIGERRMIYINPNNFDEWYDPFAG